jgi:hypothetical protein
VSILGGDNGFVSWRKSDNQLCRLALQKMNTTSREGIKSGDIKYVMPVLIAFFLWKKTRKKERLQVCNTEFNFIQNFSYISDICGLCNLSFIIEWHISCSSLDILNYVDHPSVKLLQLSFRWNTWFIWNVTCCLLCCRWCPSCSRIPWGLQETSSEFRAIATS